MLCVLILYSTANNRFLRNFFHGRFILLFRVFARNLLKGNRRRNSDTNSVFTFNKSTHYPLDYGVCPMSLNRICMNTIKGGTLINIKKTKHRKQRRCIQLQQIQQSESGILTNTGVAFYISGFANPNLAICQLTVLSQRLTFMRLYVLSTFWHTSAICVVYSDLRDSSRPKNGIKSWTFSCVYFLQLFTWINSTTVHRWT